MDSPSFPRLISLFYTEFHPIQGPKVIYEIPEGTLINSVSPTSGTPSGDTKVLLSQVGESRLFDFEAISDYIIPKTQLCENILTFTAGSYKVVGHPMTIENRKYERNALMFNLCWVFDAHAVVNSYEPIISKMAVVLRSLEIENEFLSDHNKRKSLLPAMEHMLEDLNNICEARITLSSMDIINLKLFPSYQQPLNFEMFEVPVPIAELTNMVDSTWDITTNKLLRHIDGVNHVKRIISLSEVDSTLAKKSMEHLLYYGCVVMVDLFQYSNIYAVKPSINRTIEDVILQRECMAYLFRPGVTSPSFAKIFSLYCSLKPGLTLHQWIEENQVESLNLDVRRFINFGILYRFLYRLHKYPVLTQDSSGVLPLQLRRYLTGKHHYDEICVEFGYSSQEMDSILSREPGIKFFYR
ncbi:Nitrogen permease regulator 2 [Entomophthora muscae]|uniref:Nitrogen permease regulator 2 n=2 Tax=Entomophthora muscae TaxID=34485 RepID=A0ACC2T8K5_9FUNG|nr:Nitrogen permease regulator 2 [Entomophthora muscae]